MQAEVLHRLLEVAVDLRLPRVGAGPVVALERERVDVRVDVDLGARVLVVPPRATDALGLLVDRERVMPALRSSTPAEMPPMPAPTIATVGVLAAPNDRRSRLLDRCAEETAVDHDLLPGDVRGVVARQVRRPRRRCRRRRPCGASARGCPSARAALPVRRIEPAALAGAHGRAHEPGRDAIHAHVARAQLGATWCVYPSIPALAAAYDAPLHARSPRSRRCSRWSPRPARSSAG